jgi:hypothetical protein
MVMLGEVFEGGYSTQQTFSQFVREQLTQQARLNTCSTSSRISFNEKRRQSP